MSSLPVPIVKKSYEGQNLFFFPENQHNANLKASYNLSEKMGKAIIYKEIFGNVLQHNCSNFMLELCEKPCSYL